MSVNHLSSARLEFGQPDLAGGDPTTTAWEPVQARISVTALPDSVPSWGPVSNRLPAGFGSNDFLRELQREKRRSDRSGSPLSMTVYRIDSANRQPGDAEACIDRLESSLQDKKRQTDILARVDHRTFAVLFPDTSLQGARRFIEKMAPSLQDLVVTANCAIYPSKEFDELLNGVEVDRIRIQSLLDDPAFDSTAGYPLKRALDILGASVAVVLLSPLMLVTAVAIATTSPGPVIYKQQRLGRGGTPFTFYKFRSMVANVDDGIHRKFVTDLIKGKSKPQQAAGKATVYKMKTDPRITRVGRWIRRLSIDEVPQFFNVLKGDMSLVGPRPPLPYEAENYQVWHLRRVQNVKPGITGIWQVDGRSKVSFDEMVRMDLRYIRKCSLMLDLNILLKTVLVVVRGDGAA